MRPATATGPVAKGRIDIEPGDNVVGLPINSPVPVSGAALTVVDTLFPLIRCCAADLASVVINITSVHRQQLSDLAAVREALVLIWPCYKPSFHFSVPGVSLLVLLLI